MNPKQIPWKLLLSLYWQVRSTVFRTKKHDVHLEADASLEEVRSVLGDAHFTNNWEFSYYQGEDLNMRRPRRKNDKHEWYQTHVRGYERENGTVGLSCHTELEPSEYPKGHLNTVNYDLKEGTQIVREVLENADIEVTDLRRQSESENSADGGDE